uniref:Uncharacterized protein n=1 Tax=Magallana gigas TaxID=29159 RepID=A0A8W8NZ42_MAGGI
MGVAALALVVLLVLGCALRALLRHFGVQCRTPVRRRPMTKRDDLCQLKEGSRFCQKSSSGEGGLKMEDVEMHETGTPEETEENTRSKTQTS